MAFTTLFTTRDWLPPTILLITTIIALPLLRYQLQRTLSIHTSEELVARQLHLLKLDREHHPEDSIPLSILETLCASPVHEIREAAEKVALDRFLRIGGGVQRLQARANAGEEGFADDLQRLEQLCLQHGLATDVFDTGAAAEVDTGSGGGSLSPEERELRERETDAFLRQVATSDEETIRRLRRRARREAVVVGSEGGDGRPTILMNDVQLPEEHEIENDDLNSFERAPPGMIMELAPLRRGDSTQQREDAENNEPTVEDEAVLAEWIEGYGDETNVAEVDRPRFRMLNDEQFEI